MKYFLALFFTGALSISYSQFTSFTSNTNFIQSPINTYGIDSSSLNSPVLQVKITPSDLNDVGNVSVIIFDSISDTPLSGLNISVNEITSGVAIENNVLVFNFGNLSLERSYKIYVEAQNLQMAYLLPSTFYFTEN